MKWLELCIDTARDGLDKLEAMLSALGIDGIEIEDEADFQSFLAGNRKYWDYVDEDLLAQKKGKCRIKCYLEDDEEAAAQLARVRLGMEDVKAAHSGEALGPMTLTVKEVQDADWENNWKQYYQPIAIGERLLVVPEWLETEAADRVPLVLDPGRESCYHPYVSQTAGQACARRRTGAGFGLRQRYFVHCCPVLGRTGGVCLRH